MNEDIKEVLRNNESERKKEYMHFLTNLLYTEDKDKIIREELKKCLESS